MFRRVLTGALAVSLAMSAGFSLPSPASAQGGSAFEPPDPPRLRVSPFAGYLNGFTRHEQWVRQDGADTTRMDATVYIGNASGGGVLVDALLSPRFGVAGAVAAYSRGETVFTVASTDGATRTDGATVLIGRLGMSAHLPTEQSELVLRRLEASVSAGGLVYHERPRDDLGTAGLLGNSTHVGLNVALTAAFPFAGDRLSVHAGAENNVIFWRESSLARLPQAYLVPGTAEARTTASAGSSHSWLLRAGIGFRFR